MDPGGSAIEAIDGDISAVADATTPSDGLSSATPPDVPQRNPDIGDTDPEPAAHSPGDGAVTVEVASIPVAIPVAGPHDVTLAAGQAIDKMAEDILGREEQAELEQELAELEVEVQADLQTQLEHAQAKIQALRAQAEKKNALVKQFIKGHKTRSAAWKASAEQSARRIQALSQQVDSTKDLLRRASALIKKQQHKIDELNRVIVQGHLDRPAAQVVSPDDSDATDDLALLLGDDTDGKGESDLDESEGKATPGGGTGSGSFASAEAKQAAPSDAADAASQLRARLARLRAPEPAASGGSTGGGAGAGATASEKQHERMRTGLEDLRSVVRAGHDPMEACRVWVARTASSADPSVVHANQTMRGLLAPVLAWYLDLRSAMTAVSAIARG